MNRKGKFGSLQPWISEGGIFRCLVLKHTFTFLFPFPNSLSVWGLEIIVWEKLNESFNWYNGSSVFNPKIGAMNVFFFLNFLEKKGREGEKYPFVVLLVYSFTGWFLYVLLLGI